MTVIRPNSISGITSITAQANEINIFRSDGTLAGLQINGVNFNNTSGISTLAALNVTGNVSIAGTLTYEDVTNVDSVGILTARDDIKLTAAEGKIEATGATGLTLNASGGSAFARVRVAGNTRLHITSDGKIGISSTAPNTRLDVIESSASRTWTPGSSVVSMFERNGHCRIAMVAGSSSYSQIDFGDTNDDNVGYIKYDHNDNSMSFRTNVVERLRIASDGKVGIGEESPDTNLHVKGTGTDILKIESTAAGAQGVNLIMHHASASPADNDVISLIQFNGLDDSNNSTTYSSIRAVATDVSNNSESGDITFHTRHAGSFSEKVRIASNGRVGIGTINPAYGLDVMHDTGIIVRSSTNGVGAAISFTDASTNNWDQIGTIKYFHQNNVVENGIAEGFIIQGTESTTAVKIEGLLRVTAQPCASVYQCTGPSGNAVTSDSQNGDPLHFDHVDINQGGMTISNNNARIQVPVDGIYFVSYMVSGTVNVVDVNDGLELVLRKNGGEYPAANSRAEPVFNMGADANAEEFFCNNTLLVQCSKDDYLEVSIANINNSDGTINRGNFMVMLMA